MSEFESLAADLLERRKKLIIQSQEIARRGITEGRDLSVEEQASFESMLAEAEALTTRAQKIHEGEQRGADLAASFRRPDEQRESADGAFGKWAREARIGDGFDLMPTKDAERRAISRYRNGGESRAMDMSGTGTNSVYSQLWEYAVAGSQILQAGVDIINTSDGNTLPMPAVTAHATGASAAVSAPITASDAGLTIVNLDVIKRGYLTVVPSELVQDVSFDLEGYLARAAGRELGKIVSKVAADAAIAGYTVSGSTLSASAMAPATGALLADSLITLFHSVLPEYRTTAAWVMNDVWAAEVRKGKDGSGRYVWEPSLVPGNPGRIDGMSVYADPNFPTAKTSTTKAVYFGDWSSLKVRIAGGLRFERSTEYKFGNDQIAYRALVRTGAAVVDPNAVKYLVLTA